MAYQELIKNFDKIRAYMRDFYIYGFKSRNDFDHKSMRSYDNERRRIESYLGDHMAFHHSAQGKQVFVSIDCKHTKQNPFYQAWKSKSFTSIDITLHFILFDILHDPFTQRSFNEIVELIDHDYLSCFDNPLLIDASTVRKKLKEYCDMGLIISEKQGKQLLYHRASTFDLSPWKDAISFYSEAGMDGVIGSYLMDQMSIKDTIFTFKHHYMTRVLESEVLYTILCAIQEQKEVEIHVLHQKELWQIIPLKIFVSTQNGRDYVIGYHKRFHQIRSFRLDHIIKAVSTIPAEQFQEHRAELNEMQKHMWGVCCSNEHRTLEHVEFTIRISLWEEYIYQRLQREARCGHVERLDANTARFYADVYDTTEMIPWIRTFLCRITQMNFSNRSVENQFKQDIQAMMKLYGIGGEEDAVS